MKRVTLIILTCLALLFITLTACIDTESKEDAGIETGAGINRISNNDFVSDARISNGQVVWSGFDGDDDEIYL
jgi:hypothetical protein